MVFDPGATSRSLGSGVGEGTRVPALRASDPVLGSATTVDLQGGAAGSLIVLQVSFGAAQPSRIAPNAWLYSGPYPAPLYVQPMSGADWQATIPVPNDPLLQGLDVQLQAGLLGTGSSAPFELTNGVHAVLGS
ncbi:MAG: hypothetical protein KAI24_08505 [Planctomycetes bacterium]|nr:hypothetical protein [Planctomycetota bacterium]